MKYLSRQFQHPHTQLFTVLALSMATLMPATVFARENDAHEDRAELRISYAQQTKPYHCSRTAMEQTRSYAQPVYVPPPVYYQTQRSPGIDLFFPLNIHR